MTRIKKTRKIGSNGIRKQETRVPDDKPNRRKKTPKGKKSGSRNSLILESQSESQTNNKNNKNSKLGSKKPIELIKAPTVAPVVVSTEPKPTPQAQLVKTPTIAISAEDELQQIESDPVLIDLVERVEKDEVLKGKEAKYFNVKMARHAELLEILGLDHQDAEDESDTEDFGGTDQWDDLLDRS